MSFRQVTLIFKQNSHHQVAFTDQFQVITHIFNILGRSLWLQVMLHIHNSRVLHTQIHTFLGIKLIVEENPNTTPSDHRQVVFSNRRLSHIYSTFLGIKDLWCISAWPMRSTAQLCEAVAKPLMHCTSTCEWAAGP